MKHECEAIMRMERDGFGADSPTHILYESNIRHHGSKIIFRALIDTRYFRTIDFERRRITPLGNTFIDTDQVLINYCPFCGERLTDETEG